MLEAESLSINTGWLLLGPRVVVVVVLLLLYILPFPLPWEICLSRSYHGLGQKEWDMGHGTVEEQEASSKDR